MVTLENTRQRGPRKKNAHTSLPRTVSQSKEGSSDGNEVSRSEEESLEHESEKEVDVIPINRTDSPQPLHLLQCAPSN